MDLITMYPPQKDSPLTFLAGDISTTDTIITVASFLVLPQTVPYPLTIGIDKTVTETVIVTAQDMDNNQLTVVRGSPSYSWTAGSKVARVLTAQDVTDIQDNIIAISEDLNTKEEIIGHLDTDVSDLNGAVGDENSGLIKDLADEIERATAAENSEVVRATAAESNLNTNKINRSELAQVITDWTYLGAPTKVEVTITRYNATTQQTSQYTRVLPIVSDENVGVMTPEAYSEIGSLRADVNALINMGGRFIGVSFATKANLNSYVVPSTVKNGDFTYVLDDETKNNSTTRYVRNGTSWDFTFVIEYDPIGTANTTTLGIVKSKNADGKVFVETDGTMSVVGWDSLKSENITVNFITAATKTDISSGSTLAVLFGVLKKWYASFGAAAWLGTGTTSGTVASGDHGHTAEAVGALGTSGNSSSTTVAFTAAVTLANISTGETLAVLFGKLSKWYSSFGTAAWKNTGTTSNDVATGNHTHNAYSLTNHTHSYAPTNVASALANRTTAANVADTGYTTLMFRGSSLNSADTTPAVNGAIAWTYE